MTIRPILSAIAALCCMASAYAAHPVENLLERIDKGASKKIAVKEIPGSKDFFEISSTPDGRPLITGNNPVNIAAGLNWYLKYYPNIHISWNSLTAEIPDSLPVPDKPERHETDKSRRYYLNYCTHSYSMAFWDWDRWEKEIDWMALHGINMPLAMTGTDVVWRNTLRRLGYTNKEADEFIAGPAFQAWWLMNNLEGWGGPNSEQWYADRADLQKRIVERMRTLGMEPVLPGYSGMVPHDADERLGLNVSGKGIWNGFVRPAFMIPTEPRFNEIAAIYYDELTKLNGKAKYYSMDPFHEGGSTEGVDLAQAGGIIADAMKRVNPEAVWVIQGWNENPNPKLLEGVKKGDIVVLDLASEIKPNWGDPESPSPFKRADGYSGHDWMWNMVLNFGGNVGLHGRMDNVIEGYYRACNSERFSPTLCGFGLTPEGIENNPAMFELASELIWRPEQFTRDEWLKEYTGARYGTPAGEDAPDADILDAWKRLGATILNCPWGNLQQGTTESVFCARPSTRVWQASSWSKMHPYYNPADVIEAARIFAKAAPRFKGNNNYEYDLVDIVRQGIAEKGRLTYNDMVAALRSRDTTAFNRHSTLFLDLIKAQDELLRTRPEFKVGKWIADARALADNPQEKDLMEQNARLLITTWGPRTASEKGGLRDYGHREWAGVLADLYHDRWSRWIDMQRDLLARGEAPVDTYADRFAKRAAMAIEADYSTGVSWSDVGDSEIGCPIDFYEIDEQWVNSRKHYSPEAEGDPVEVATRIVAAYLN